MKAGVELYRSAWPWSLPIAVREGPPVTERALLASGGIFPLLYVMASCYAVCLSSCVFMYML